MDKKIIPMAGLVLVKQDKGRTQTGSGIYLQNSDLEKPQQATVLAIQSTDKQAPVKVGDVIIFKKWGSNEVKIDGEEYQFIKFEDILAIIE